VNETTIRCAGCGFEGKSADGFRSEGHDPLRGCLYYRCPSCSRQLFVDPMEALASSRVQGVPSRQRMMRPRWYRSLNVLLVLSGIGLAHWWAYVASAILLTMVWQFAEPVGKGMSGIGYRVAGSASGGTGESE
jgi:hypothetical protein